MAINLGNTQEVATQEADGSVVLTKEVASDTREQYGLSSAKSQYEIEIRESGIIDKLTESIDISNTTSIIEFGKEPAQKMAALADQVLQNYNGATVDETSKLVDNLLAVMKKIDIQEIKSLDEITAERKKKGLFSRFAESAQQKLDRLVNKYKGIGNEMEQICSQLSIYEQQIKDSNRDISKMYEAAKEEYKQMVAVIMAAEQACKEIEEYRDEKQAEFEKNGNPDLQFEVTQASQALTLMEQRTADLRGSEAVALQSIPTFKIQEVTNANLARKVNSAFIVTVPAFKTALVNSVIAKQQSIQAQGLMALDQATDALIRKNAENAVGQLKLSQQLANTSAIKAETIEAAWNTIMTGIQEYKENEKTYAEIRKEEARRIEAANATYLKGMHDNTVL